MITLYDQQTGKMVSGTIGKVTQYSFELVTDKGVMVFPRDHLPPDYE
jgi:hypothetical protein